MNAPLAWTALGITLVVIVAYEAWPSQGTRFRVWVPIKPPPPEPSQG